MDSQKDLKKCEKGQSLVEFSFGMVILVILLAGIMDLGRALFTYMALREAAQEGALYASTDPTNSAEIINRVQNSSSTLQDLADDGTNLTVQVTTLGGPCTGNGIRVRVFYANFPLAMPFLGTIIGSQTINLSATVTDTILSPACH